MTTTLVAYYRVSTERQGRSGLGLDAQREIARRHAKATGGRIVAEFSEVISGRKSRRPQLAHSLAACREHGASLVVAKLDRLMRDARSLLELVDGGVPLVVCDVPTADDPAVTRMVLTVLGAMAEFESRRIGTRIREAIAAKKRKAGRSNTGMDNHTTRMAVERANKARSDKAIADRERVKALCARMTGKTAQEMADALNRKGVKTRNGKEWTAGNLWRVLKG